MAETPKMPAPTYIGDGVYASFDGWQLWLRTQRETGMHEIALEPNVLHSLIDYARTVGVLEREEKP